MAGLDGALTGPSSNVRPSPPRFPSPFDKVPTETIREILSFAFSPEDFMLPPWPIQLQPFALNDYMPQSQSQTDKVRISLHIVLSLVCEKWLDIMTAHHSLWATFRINPIAHLDPRFSVQLRLHLQRSGAHSLKIQVQAGWSGQVVSDFIDAMMVHSERWESIELRFPLKYHFLQQLDAVKDRLPLLQRLHLKGTPAPYPTGILQCATFQSAPSLTDISLEEMDTDAVRILNLPWDRVSNVRLDFPTAAGSLLSDSLQTLTTLTLYRGGMSPDGLRFPVTLENLQALHVLSHTSSMGHLTCPSLEELHVCNEDGASILAFLDNSASCPLSRLELRYVGLGYPNGEGIPQILQHSSLAGVTFLQLAHCEITDRLLDALVLDSGQRLSVLETLVLDLEFNTFQLNRDFKSRVEGLRRIIQSRTYSTHASKPSLDSPEPRPVLNDTAGSSLKEFVLRLTVDIQGWKASHEEDIERLRKFCMERKVLVLVHITYAVENPNVDRYEQGFRDGGYDVFDADYTEDIDDPL